MERDPSIIMLGEDIAGGAGRAHLGFVDAWGGPMGSTKGLIQQFGPDRTIDTPICETSFIPPAAYTAKGLLAAAIRDDNPVVYFSHRKVGPTRMEVPEEPYTLEIGKARTLRQGRDVTLVGISHMTNICREAAEDLATQGVEAEVIDLLSLAPLDEECLLESIRRTKH